MAFAETHPGSAAGRRQRRKQLRTAAAPGRRLPPAAYEERPSPAPAAPAAKRDAAERAGDDSFGDVE